MSALLTAIVRFMSFGSGISGLSDASHLRFKRVWVSLGVLLICMILVLSLINLAPIEGVLLQDKIIHFLAYGLLMGWFAQICRHHLARFLLVLALVAMGVLVEYLQGLVNYRQFDYIDMLANASGIVVAWALSYTWMGRILVGIERLITRAWPPSLTL